MKPMRLFDYLTEHVNSTPDHFMLSGKVRRDGVSVWESLTFAQVQDMADRMSLFLLDLDLKKDDKIALISENRWEWNIVDLGALQIGVVCVPMYPTISESDYAFIFKDAGIKYAFVGNETILQKVNPLMNVLHDLQAVFCFDAIDGQPRLMDRLPQEGNRQEIESRKAEVKPEDLACIIYTSGTTGNPKGVMLTHSNLVSNVESVKEVTPFQPERRTLSFLPLCHSFEHMVFFAYLALGMHNHYVESLDTIGENLKEVKPYCFTTVPRLLEKVYEKIQAKGAELKGMKRMIFDWAMNVGSRYKVGAENGLLYNIQLGIARKLVFSKWQEALGGEVAFIVTGAAAMQPRLIALFTAAGIPVIEGYGLTETSPVLTVNRVEERMRCTGTVGLPIPGVEIKIASDGEILAKGPNVMTGYYNRPDLTAEVIDSDGWFHTGDIGEWVMQNGYEFLKITDRKKELFKTAGGKYIAPQAIENKMKESAFIEQIMVVGGDDKKYIAALVVPSFPQLRMHLSEQGISGLGEREIIGLPAVVQLMDAEIDRMNAHFGKWEQLKKVKLVHEEWTVQSGELTPTMKLKRRFILEKYREEIDSLF